MKRVQLNIEVVVLRDVRHAVRGALAKHVRKLDSDPGVKHGASHKMHADRLRAFLTAVEKQVGDLKYGR